MPTAERTKSKIGAIVSHPLTRKCLVALTERQASPAELAREWELDAGTVAHHVKKLRDAEMIHEVDSRAVRGSTERFYRAIERPMLQTEESSELSPQQRAEWVEYIFALMSADVLHSMAEGAFSRRPDHLIARFPTNVDEKGWEDLVALFEQVQEKAFDIEAESAARSAQSGEETFPVRVMSLVFEMP